MQNGFLSSSEIMDRFPGLRPSQLDYLVRERLVDCEKNGHGLPRRYPQVAIEKIRQFLGRRPVEDQREHQLA